MTRDGPAFERPEGTFEPRRHEIVNLYELMEISPRASQDVIQAAYRVLARQYHPDRNATAEAAERIRRLNAAYAVLSDPKDRARYDLDCLRAQRFERIVHPNHTGSSPRPTQAGHARTLPVRLAASQRTVTDQRFGRLNGPAILGLLAVAAVVAIFIALFSVAFDTSGDSSSVFEGPNSVLVGH